MLEVDAIDLLQETVDEMLARLFTVADDIEAGVFLGLDPQQRGVGLGLQQFGAFGFPLRPEFLGFGQPGRLGQAASDRSGEHPLSLQK